MKYGENKKHPALYSYLIFIWRIEYSTPVGRELEKLLKIPINNFGNMLTVLQLSHFVPLISMYDFEGRKAMSCYIADDVVETETFIPSVEQVDYLNNWRAYRNLEFRPKTGLIYIWNYFT